MVGLAAGTILIPNVTVGRGDVAVEDTALETAATEPLEATTEEEGGTVQVVIVGDEVTRGEMAAQLSNALGSPHSVGRTTPAGGRGTSP